MTAKQKTGIRIALLIVLIALPALSVRNWLNHSKPLKQELRQLEEQTETARELLSRQIILQRNLNRSIDALQSLTPQIPPRNDEYAWAYETLSRCARQAQLLINSCEEAAPHSPGDDRPYEVLLTAEGGNRQLTAFFQALEKENPLLRIKTLSITSPIGTEDFRQIQIRIQWPSPITIEGHSLL
jgi:uncharacterized membrane protein YccC